MGKIWMGKKWTAEDKALARRLYEMGAKKEEVEEAFNRERSYAAVIAEITRQRHTDPTLMMRNPAGRVR